jgi:hypothetical protein
MTNALHIQHQPDAPIACDMSTARDTPEERLAEYGRLFERALAGRERETDGAVLRFRAEPGIREAIDELARREAACCPFVDYHVETVGDEVVYRITNPVADDQRAAVDVMLDAFYALPDHAGSDFDGYLARLAERGVHVTDAGGDRFEFA